MMNNRTRNRLIGIITILLIIIIFFPYVIRKKSLDDQSAISLTVPVQDQPQSIINDHDRDSDEDTELDMTDIPAVVTMPPTPSSKTQPSQPVVDSEADLHTMPSPSTTTSSVAVTDKNYSIQLVALKNKQKIEELVALLRLHNYDVYTDPKNPVENQIIRLFIGPYSSKDQAELVILDLKNLTKLQGIIVVR